MNATADPRIPVEFAPAHEAGPDDAVLIEVDGGFSCAIKGFVNDSFASGHAGHAIGCSCCRPRGAVAEALGRLFLAGARGDVPPFRRVVAVTQTASGEAAVRSALAEDRLAAGRFRVA